MPRSASGPDTTTRRSSCRGDEPPRTVWTEIIFFAERLVSEPALIPADPADRAAMFGLCHEICGEDGLGWSRRLMMLHEVLQIPALADSPAGDPVRRLGARYGYSPEAAEAAPSRAAEVLACWRRACATRAPAEAGSSWATRCRRSTCTGPPSRPS